MPRKRDSNSKRNVSLEPSENADCALTELRGSDVVDFIHHMANPTGYRSDWLLLRAKRCALAAKASHLRDGELRAIAWFAFLPEEVIFKNADGTRKLRAILCSLTNQSVNTFLDIWLRDPDATARLLSALRDKLNDPETAQSECDFLESGSAGKLPVKGDSFEAPEKRKPANAKRERVKAARRPSRAHRAFKTSYDTLPMIRCCFYACLSGRNNNWPNGRDTTFPGNVDPIGPHLIFINKSIIG